MKIQVCSPEAVVKRAFYMAWQACGGPQGMGFLQNCPGATEEKVWNNVVSHGDYPGGAEICRDKPGTAYGDYVFGRMMKLSINWTKDAVEVRDSEPRRDYQSWCGVYPTYADLIEAAVKSLEEEHVTAEAKS